MRWAPLRESLLRALSRLIIDSWVSRLYTRRIPVFVDDAEVLIRAAMYSHHFRNKKFSYRAFEPPPETDEVSVCRQPFVEPWLAKAHAKLFVQNAPEKMYKGLAFISAAQVRQLGSRVVDGRDEFLGHADIRHGIVKHRNEPINPPELKKEYEDRLRAMANSAKYIEDPCPSKFRWKGPQL
jgi:hypothetical protein